jgi:hypothetical protein
MRLPLGLDGLLLGPGKVVCTSSYRGFLRDCNLWKVLMAHMSAGGGGKRLSYVSFNAVVSDHLLMPPVFSWTSTGCLNWLNNCSVITQPCTNNNNNEIAI